MYQEEYEYPVEPVEEAVVNTYLESHPLNRSPSPLLDEPGAIVEDSDDTLRPSSDPYSILSEFYGFVTPLVELQTQPGSVKKWKECRRTIGLVHVEIDSVSSFEESMLRFASSLIAGTPQPDSWDLHNRNPLALVSVAKDSFFEVGLVSAERPCRIFVLSSPTSPASAWVLGLYRAADLLYAFRLLDRGAGNIYGVARLLIQRGVPFRTLQHLRPIAPSFSMSSIVRFIPIRLSDYTFTPHDYATYLHDRLAILSGPRGRSALLRGGIVWRLAKDYLSHDATLEGPSHAVRAYRVGQSFRDSRSDCENWEYWDDDLTKDEWDSLCGLYRCYTGMSLSFPLKFRAHLWKVMADRLH
jgi:hypothetical protein